MVTVTINGRKTQVPPGATIMGAANQLGIDIPSFCNDDRLRSLTSCGAPIKTDNSCCDGDSCAPVSFGYEAPLIQRCTEHGDCKICSVEVDGIDGLPTACTTECTDGMAVRTESPAAVKARKDILLHMLARHPMDCLNCGKLGECKLQRYCEKYGIEEPLYTIPYDHRPVDDSNRFYYAEMDKCISCGKCVRLCKHLMGVKAIKMAQYGNTARVMPAKGANLAESDCVHCGNCVS
jgi:NADH dehydrogenase/NADH:ubiquinone oxidoreductase subunit G